MLGYILDPTLQVQDVHGGTIAGAKIYLYDSNTSELATSYKDFNGAMNTNPIITDTLGNCTVIGLKGQSYDAVFKDANDNLLFSKQNLTIGNGAVGGGNTIVSAGYGIVVTPSVSGSIDNFEVAIDPAVVATISGANAIEAGDNILIKTTASGTKQINVTSAIHLANAVYQSDFKRNGIETQNILTEDYTQVKPDGVRVANDSDDNYFIMNQHAVEGGDGNDLVHLDATSLDIDHDDGTYERQIHLGTAGGPDSDWFQGLLIKNSVNNGSLSADTYDVKLHNNTGTYSLTAANQIANSAWNAIVNGDISANYAVSAGYATNAGSANYATSAGSANYTTSAGYATSASSADYATNAGSANYATSAGSANYATSAGSATYATTAHTADTLPYGRASWNGPSFQGDKIVAIIDKTNYNYGDVIVTFDIYETLAGMTDDAYRGKLCIDLRRNAEPAYTFYVSYTGKKLNLTTLYVKRDASNKVYVIFNKTNSNYCGVKAVVKSATGWQGHDFTDYITLNDDPAVSDTSSYTNITISESQPAISPMGGRGDISTPVYIDGNGVAQECTNVDVTPYTAGPGISISNHQISCAAPVYLDSLNLPTNYSFTALDGQTGTPTWLNVPNIQYQNGIVKNNNENCYSLVDRSANKMCEVDADFVIKIDAMPADSTSLAIGYGVEDNKTTSSPGCRNVLFYATGMYYIHLHCLITSKDFYFFAQNQSNLVGGGTASVYLQNVTIRSI